MAYELPEDLAAVDMDDVEANFYNSAHQLIQIQDRRVRKPLASHCDQPARVSHLVASELLCDSQLDWWFSLHLPRRASSLTRGARQAPESPNLLIDRTKAIAMTQFINRKEDIVSDAIDGAIAASGGDLSRLDGYPFIRVVVRSDWDRSQVALVSGGGSGHEPAHAGFVGKGLLTAAVCGDVFASPSVDAVLAGILAVTGSAGCLLIVKNYTGDRLNFGLAAERARAKGLKVNMVIVDDDIALPDLPQARGVAGTLFVHKIAGAMAESGATLDAITSAAQRVIAGTKSIGMSLDTCTVPGSPKEDRIAAGKAELGLGIHGEAGVQQVEFHNAEQAMAEV
jgi:dihydroxyacetone kinase